MRTALFILMLVIVAACTTNVQVNNFEECVNAGGVVTESEILPRQCMHNKKNFIEELSITEFTKCVERPDICTMDYNSVCAFIDNGVRCITAPCQSFDAVDMPNGCSACSDEKALGHYPGACEDNTFAICENRWGFDVEREALVSGWICVDICPGNFDSYMTQTGAEMCIAHIGVEEISTWEICAKSSANCDCVKTYETTSGEQIEDADFRCVPDKYAKRMLFRAGITRLDENGRESTVIA